MLTHRKSALEWIKFNHFNLYSYNHHHLNIEFVVVMEVIHNIYDVRDDDNIIKAVDIFFKVTQKKYKFVQQKFWIILLKKSRTHPLDLGIHLRLNLITNFIRFHFYYYFFIIILNLESLDLLFVQSISGCNILSLCNF